MKTNNAHVRESVQELTELFRPARRMDIALQLRGVMRKNGLKNIDLAERLGVSEANVSRWLKGNQNLSLDTLYLLADALSETLQVQIGSTASMVPKQVSDGSTAAVAACEASRTEGVSHAYGDAWEDSPSCIHGSNVRSLAAYRNALPKVPVRCQSFAPAKSEWGVGVPSDFAYQAGS